MSQPSAKMIVTRENRIGDIDPRLYGSFVEHVGRAVYGGLYEPGHPEADACGFRNDVLALVRALQVPVIRYPGGNFVSGYRWEDGVGPLEQRPRRLDLAWRSVETNAIGVNEFVRWTSLANSQPMMAVNLGTRGLVDACNLLEYCNLPGGTQYADLRRSHGVSAPHGIKLWCLGNEMDGPWQVGHKTADEYGRLASETARAMRRVDDSVELVLCGSSFSNMPTFPEWESITLKHAYDEVNYISLHQYFTKQEGDSADFLAQTVELDRFIGTVVSACDYIKAVRRSPKTMYLSFDEWNVWYHSNGADDHFMRDNPWHEAPALLEERFTFEDALMVGGMLITLMRHANRVKVACLAQLINAIAPIMTKTGGGCYRQTTYYPFLHASLYGRGVSLQPTLISDKYDSRRYTDVSFVDGAAVLDEEERTLTLFVLNRNLEADMNFAVELRGFTAPPRLLSHTVLHHDDLTATNDLDREVVTPHLSDTATLTQNGLSTPLKRASWNVIRLEVSQKSI